MSQTKSIAEAILARVAALSGVAWDKDPFGVWFPEFDRADLKESGLTAMVISPKTTWERKTRAELMASPEVHIAVVKPITPANAAGKWTEGETVVNAAQLIIEDLLGQPLTAGQAVMTVDNEPIISADYARQYQLWVSYLKFEIVAI